MSPTTTRPNLPAPRVMMSRWPTVTGSKVPGQMAVTLLGIRPLARRQCCAGSSSWPAAPSSGAWPPTARTVTLVSPYRFSRTTGQGRATTVDAAVSTTSTARGASSGPSSRPSSRLQLGIAGVRWVRKHESIALGAPRVIWQHAARVAGEHAAAAAAGRRGRVGAGGAEAEARKVVPQHPQRGLVLLDERAPGGAARQGLEAQRAAAGEHVEHGLARHRTAGQSGRLRQRPQHGEHGFAHLVRRGPRVASGRRRQGSSPPLAAHDPHGRAPARPGWAGVSDALYCACMRTTSP